MLTHRTPSFDLADWIALVFAAGCLAAMAVVLYFTGREFGRL